MSALIDARETDGLPVSVLFERLPIRTANALRAHGRRHGRMTIGDVRASSNAKLRRIEQVGQRGLVELRDLLLSTDAELLAWSRAAGDEALRLCVRELEFLSDDERRRVVVALTDGVSG